MGLNWADHTVEIEAPIESCFDAIVDYESFPAWQGAVTSVEVLSHTEEGIGQKVTLFLSTKGQKVNYTLDYAYERPTRISWDFVEGNGVDDVDGEYTFEDLGGDRTRATYRLGIDPSLPVPGMIARRIHRQALESSVEELKREAERRHTASATRVEREPEPAAPSPPAPPPPAEPAPPAPPPPAPTPPAPSDETAEPAPAVGATAWSEPAESQSSVGRATSEPGTVERAVSAGRDVAGGAARAGVDVAGGALGAARGAAHTAVGLGRDAAGAVSGRLSRLLGRGGPDHR